MVKFELAARCGSSAIVRRWTMPKRLSKPRREDPNQAAFRAVQRIAAMTEDAEKPAPSNVVPITRRKNPAAVALGRKGGLRSAAARMEKIPEAKRRRIASDAARARWARVRGEG